MTFDPELFRERAELTWREYLQQCLQWLKENPEARQGLFRRRRQRRLAAMPPWADRAAMLALHREARQLTRKSGVRHQVEFIVPLNHPLVCGLYIPHNMWIVREGGRSFRWRHRADELLDELELCADVDGAGDEQVAGAEALDEAAINRMIEEEFGDDWGA